MKQRCPGETGWRWERPQKINKEEKVNKHHSTVSRRDFMRGLGLAGAGLGAAAAAAPVFHDMDEIVASPKSNWQRPWWVKQRNFGDTVQEMDWNVYQRFDPNAYGTTAAMIDMFGAEEVARLNQLRANTEAEHMVNNTPGYTLRDRGLYQNLPNEGIRSGFLGYRKTRTPQKWGDRHDPPITVPRWEGTKEENSRMMRTVLKLRGAAVVGFSELDDKSIKFIYAREGKREYVFEDVEDAYVTDDKNVTPNKCKWVIAYSAPMAEEMIRRMPSALAEGAVMLGYSYGRIINSGVSEFLRGIGYLGLGAGDNSYKVHPPFAVWSGISEPSRAHQLSISPEMGTSQRVFAIVTDLPLEVTPPIDAGIFRYCRTCKKCAEACPGGALDAENDEPSWETKYGPTNQAGQKAYPFSFAMCRKFWCEISTGCGICMARCPFAHKNDGTIHDVISAAISTMPIFNGFFKNLDDAFGYGFEADQEAWWDLQPRIYGMYTETKGI